MLVDLARGHPPALVAEVLSQEVARGRVVRVAGGYALVPGAFPRDVLAALRRIAPADLDGACTARRRGRAPVGRLARSFA
jgi:hypothetical protein